MRNVEQIEQTWCNQRSCPRIELSKQTETGEREGGGGREREATQLKDPPNWGPSSSSPSHSDIPAIFVPLAPRGAAAPARTCCIASRGHAVRLRTSSVMPVRGVRYECTFFLPGFPRHVQQASLELVDQRICATSPALCSFPVATHSTSMEKYMRRDVVLRLKLLLLLLLLLLPPGRGMAVLPKQLTIFLELVVGVDGRGLRSCRIFGRRYLYRVRLGLARRRGLRVRALRVRSALRALNQVGPNNRNHPPPLDNVLSVFDRLTSSKEGPTERVTQWSTHGAASGQDG